LVKKKFNLYFVIQSALNMNKNSYQDDLRQIKDIMSRSTPFISLSGLSGISTGIIALIGAFIAYQWIFIDSNYWSSDAVEISNESFFKLLLTAMGTLILAVSSAIYFTSRKTKHSNQKVWDIHTKQLLIHLLIPLITGGLPCLMLLHRGFIGMLPAVTLIFYGIALVSGSKYTFPEIRTLGIFQILLGLIAFQFIGYSLIIWALGFGIIQGIYGLIIQRKY
jgi:hypothetical protein